MKISALLIIALLLTSCNVKRSTVTANDIDYLRTRSAINYTYDLSTQLKRMQLKQIETVYDTAGNVVKVIETTVDENTETKSDITASSETNDKEKLIDKSETVVKVKKSSTFALNLSIVVFIVCLVFFGVIYYLRKRLLV